MAIFSTNFFHLFRIIAPIPMAAALKIASAFSFASPKLSALSGRSRLPLFVRISATDWKEGGWDLEQSIELCRRSQRPRRRSRRRLQRRHILHNAKIPVGPGYQVEFSEAIRKEVGIATGAVGMITEPAQADTILSSDQADMVFLAREFLRDPYWPRRAAKALGVEFTSAAAIRPSLVSRMCH